MVKFLKLKTNFLGYRDLEQQQDQLEVATCLNVISFHLRVATT
jgi:hypothetical protein